MAEVIPTRFLFRFELPIRRFDPPPSMDAEWCDWPDDYLLPNLHEIEGRAGIARVWLGWHESGLYVAARVAGKRRPPQGDPAKFWKADHLRLMTDMRDAREVRRATRYCQQFFFMPIGGPPRGKGAAAGTHRIQRAQMHAPTISSEQLIVRSELWDDGWAVAAHIPADGLAGFNPADNPRIGVYTIVEDDELGQQYLTVGDDLSWYYDPSTWATGVMQ